MSEPAYRSEGDVEPVREARIADLLPATRDRLRQACEHEEALASAQPRWVGRPAAWVLAAGASFAVLLAPLVGSFGSIDERPFASEPHEQALLTAAILAGLVLGAFAVRSFALRRGGLPPGVFLFASGLVEIRGGRVRVWPLSRLRAIEQRKVTTLDLGEAGRVRMSTDEDSLASALASSRLRLSEAEDAQDEAALAQLDPLHVEKLRSSFWRSLPVSARLSSVGASFAATRLVVVGGLVTLGLSVAGMVGLRRASDAIALRSASLRREVRLLSQYVQQGGPLAEKADRMWLATVARDTHDAGLLIYMTTTLINPSSNPARSAHRPADADRLLALRALDRASRGQWEEKAPSRVSLPPVEENEHREGPHDLTLEEALHGLDTYLRVGLPGQPLRPLIERRRFELRLVQAAEVYCPPPRNQYELREIPEAGHDLLTPFVVQGGDRVEEAQAVLWQLHLAQATRCRSLGDLESARAMIRTPAQQAAFEAAWRAFFAELGVATTRYRESNPREADQTPLFEMLGSLWAYLRDHPETRTWGPSVQRGAWVADEITPGDERWSKLLTPYGSKTSLGLPDLLMRNLLGALPLEVVSWRDHEDGPHIEFHRLGPATERGRLVELTLTLPGSPARTARLNIPDSLHIYDDDAYTTRDLWPHSHVMPEPW